MHGAGSAGAKYSVELKSTADGLPYFISEKNLALFDKYHVHAHRGALALRDPDGNYCKVLDIESLTMLEMVQRADLPGRERVSGALAETANAKSALCRPARAV